MLTDIRPQVDVDRALLEWGRWLQYGAIGGPRRVGCGSAESRYRTPQVWEQDAPREDPPDWRIAERVERIVVQLDPRTHKVLAIWYCARPALQRQGVPLIPDDETWAWRRAHVGSADRFWQLLEYGKSTVSDQWA